MTRTPRSLVLLLLACAVACGQPDAAGRSRELTVRVGGARRTAWRHVPVGHVAGQAAPLVVFFHGRNWWAKDALTKYGLDAASDRNGFILLVPESLEVRDCGDGQSAKHWDLCFDGPAARPSRDVAFVAALIERTARDLSVDRDRVYLVGHSYGGSFAYHAAMSLPADIAAFASHAGGITEPGPGRCWPPCPAEAAPRVPGLVMHAVDDAVAPYERSTLLFAALQAAGIPSELVLLTAGGHDYDPTVTQRIWDWLAQHRKSAQS